MPQPVLALFVARAAPSFNTTAGSKGSDSLQRPLIQIIVASTRPQRRGEAIARWVHERVDDSELCDTQLIDLAEVALPLLDELRQASEGEYLHEHTRRWSRTVTRADAYIFVMPEYNHGYNAALKNALDYLYHEWRDKPVGLVGYGGASGGMRAIQAIKPVLNALKLVWAGDVAITLATTPVVDGRFDGSDTLAGSLERMIGELVRLHGALRPLRDEGTS